MTVNLLRVAAIGVFVLTVLACQKSEESKLSDAESYAEANAKIPVDPNIKLITVDGLGGLIESGDELVVLVYKEQSREGRIRSANRKLAEESLRLMKEDGARQELIRVPDSSDASGARYFLFERKNGELEYRAVCSGGWASDPASRRAPAVCDVTYEQGEIIVSLELPDSIFVKNGRKIASIVLQSLQAK